MKKETVPRNIWWYQLPSDLYFCIFKNVQCVSIFSAKLLECQRVKLAKRKATWLQHTFLVVLGSNDSVDSVKPNVKMLRSPVTAEKKKRSPPLCCLRLFWNTPDLVCCNNVDAQSAMEPVDMVNTPNMYALCGSHPNWWPPVIDLSNPNLYATIAIQASDISSFDHCSSVNNFSATSSVVPTKTILSHKEPQIQRWHGSCHQ